MTASRLQLAGLLAVLGLITASPALAADRADPLVTASLLTDTDAIVPGRNFTLGVKLEMKPHWHTYWKSPGESGDPTTVKPAAPEGLTFGELQWPIPHAIAAPGGTSFGYEGEVLLTILVTVSKDFKPKGRATITAAVTWLSCNDTCIEGKADLRIELPVGDSAKPANAELFAKWTSALPISIDRAAEAGLFAGPQSTQIETRGMAGSVVVNWKKQPAKVEWFPVGTNDVAVEDVKLTTDAGRTRISFKLTYFKKVAQPATLDAVLVYTDSAGVRHGIVTPIVTQ